MKISVGILIFVLCYSIVFCNQVFCFDGEQPNLNDKNKEDASLKNFWEKEQLLLDQKIQEGKILKIKGLYLGMNIDEAFKIIPDALKDSLALGAFRGIEEGYIIVDQPFYNKFIITSNDNKQVKKIILTSGAVDMLFNTDGLPAEDFIQKFKESYKIDNLEPLFEEDGSISWKFISTDGYKLILTSEKDILLEEIAASSEMQFD
ncbi:MAG: hypothetical protein KJ915_09180 [Candidatus Omnitrophica bacterium]|nr:hypothetical protein [Candidatus Omnitrophota bacterium]